MCSVAMSPSTRPPSGSVRCSGYSSLCSMKSTGSGLLEQPAQDGLGVVHERGGDDAQVRDADEVLLEALAVRRSVAAAAAGRRADDHRARRLAVVHRLVLRDVVDDLVEAERQEVAEHDLGDRAVAGEGEPGRHAGDRALADRRRAHPVREVRAQPARHLEGAAVRVDDVLAEQDHPLVVLERAAQRVAHRTRRDHSATAFSISSAIAASTSASITPRASGASLSPLSEIGSSAQRAATSASGRLSSFLE